MLIRYTANFVANMESIEAFWDHYESPVRFDRLLAELTQTTLPNLSQHPKLGRYFFQRSPESMDAKAKMANLSAHFGLQTANAQLREYVMTDYLLLYRVTDETIDLLAIRHHKQLSFDIDTYLNVR